MNRNHSGYRRLRAVVLVGLMAMLAGYLAVPAASAATRSSGTAWQELVTINYPARTLTVDEMRRMMAVPTVDEAVVIATDRADVPWQDLERLLAGATVPGVRLVHTVQSPAPGTTVGDLTGGDPATQAKGWKVKIKIKIVIKCEGDDCPPPPLPSG